MKIDTYADTRAIESALSMTAEAQPARAPFSQLQLINDDQQFIEDVPDGIINDWALTDAGAGYQVVAAFGTRGSGKSTLLNRLFGTSFSERESGAFGPTTRGVWISRARDKPVLVMDAQGLDNYDFDCKSTLFLMAISSVLIFNLWEHQVGLNVGANMDLLKLVIEIKLRTAMQFTGYKATILIVVRDHEDDIPLTAVRKAMDGSLEKVWADVIKPENLQGTSIRDHFDFIFTALPHKKLESAEFDRQIDKLKNIVFDDPNGPSCAFKSLHQPVPVHGFFTFSMSIWTQTLIATSMRSDDAPTTGGSVADLGDDKNRSAFEISDTKDSQQHGSPQLQEPVQEHQDMRTLRPLTSVTNVAHHDCEKETRHHVDSLNERLNRLRSRVILERRMVASLDQQVDRIRRRTKQEFDCKLRACSSGSCQAKLEELLSKIEADRRELYQAQLNNLHAAVYERFLHRISRLAKHVLNENQIIQDLGRRIRDIRDQELRSYDAKAVQFYLGGVYEVRRNELLDKLHSQLKSLCNHQLQMLCTAASSMFEEKLRTRTSRGMGFELAAAKSKTEATDYFMSRAKSTIVEDNSNWTCCVHEHWIFLEQALVKICARVHQEIKSDSSIDTVLDTLFEAVVSDMHQGEEVWREYDRMEVPVAELNTIFTRSTPVE